ncbi:MAG: chorismate mutase [Alphaproteobacteria bacterium]|jgi:chorismate mutase-like protein|nr:chorismate mutase [Alphaproteobacteria bacterium]
MRVAMAVDDNLKNLRQRIDSLDEEILSLLRARTQVVTEVGEVKKRLDLSVFMRPGREAAIIRRLLSRPLGEMPPRMVFRLWRELMMASLQLEQPFSVAVYAPPQQFDCLMLAREQFGGATPLLLFDTTAGVLRAVGEGAALVGVLPDLIEDCDERPWWRQLVFDDPAGLGVVFQLPFVEAERGARAFAVGRIQGEETGDDNSFIVLKTFEEISRGALRDAVEAAGFQVLRLAAWATPDMGDETYYLVELKDFVSEDDARLKALSSRFTIRHAGNYAVPMVLNEKDVPHVSAA